MPGMILGGRYQIQDKIGTGGMATVFRGIDEVLGRTVAVKTMLPQYAADPSFAARFKQEAQAAAALQSPYIVSIFDWGKDADTYYIVMEYLRGTDLKSGIRKHGALDPKKVAQIGSQIAQALSVAHKHDIIHRDIKPQNIMVQPDGNIKVMDFGIARAKNSHLTTDNSVLGTAHYVSPEQTQGKELGPTTDIYSLGVVMYEAVTGQVPFQGDDAISVALKQVNEQPKPPSQLNPNIDPSLEAIILKCMQKNPADRFQTADDLHRTLRDYLAGRLTAVNSATALLPVQTTTKLDRGTQPTTAQTATMPRPERTNTPVVSQVRQPSASELAARQAEESSRKRKRGIVIGVIAAIAVIAAAVFAITTLQKPTTVSVEVPNLYNLPRQEAVDQLDEAGLSVGTITSRYDDSVEEGNVCDQTPAAFAGADKGSSVDIVLSNGPEPAKTARVPNLTDMSPEAAKAALEELGLTGVEGTEEASDTVSEGYVSSQDTPAGTEVEVGSTVVFHVSTGPDTVVIPAINTGDTMASATQALESRGLVANIVYQYSDTVAYQRVISISPAAGSSIEAGGTVKVYISSGPDPSTVANVPYVIGESYATAKAQLEAAGFVVQLASGSSTEDGIVTYQSLSGTATIGSTVVLTTQLQEPAEPDTPDDGSNTGGTTDDGNGGDDGTTADDGNGSDDGSTADDGGTTTTESGPAMDW